MNFETFVSAWSTRVLHWFETGMVCGAYLFILSVLFCLAVLGMTGVVNIIVITGILHRTVPREHRTTVRTGPNFESMTVTVLNRALLDNEDLDTVLKPLRLPALMTGHLYDRFDIWRATGMYIRFYHTLRTGWTVESLGMLATRAREQHPDNTTDFLPLTTSYSTWCEALQLSAWKHACRHDMNLANTCVLAGLTINEVTIGLATGTLTRESVALLANLTTTRTTVVS